MKVLITGGGGFVGSHLADAFIARGDEVFILDTGSVNKTRHLMGNPAFHYIRDSVFNLEILEGLITKCDLIYHLAAVVGVEYYVGDPYEVLNVNVNGTQNVLKMAFKHQKKVGGRLGEILVELGFLTQETLDAFLERHRPVMNLSLRETTLDPMLIASVGAEECHRRMVVPVSKEKLTTKEKQALVKTCELQKADVDLWQKLEARSKKVETALRSARYEPLTRLFFLHTERKLNGIRYWFVFRQEPRRSRERRRQTALRAIRLKPLIAIASAGSSPCVRSRRAICDRSL